MLMGEHAVLKGSRSVVAALDKRITITCTSTENRQLELESGLGNMVTSLDTPSPPPALQFATAAVSKFSDRIPHGVRIRIASDIPTDTGLGSSAAVTVACLAAARKMAGFDWEEKALIQSATEVVRSIQGKASGADLAAATVGGVIGYRSEPLEFFQVAQQIPIALVYCGYKRKTSEVIEWVDKRWEKHPEELNLLYELVHRTVTRALGFLESGDMEEAGKLMDFNQGLMDAMGVNNADLSNLIFHLRESEEIYGAKISGSGLGDCVIGLGSKEGLETNGEILDVAASERGLEFEEE